MTALGATAIVLASLLAACGGESAGQGDLWQRQGQLLAWDRDVWIVDAVPIIVPPTVSIDGQRTLGSQVNARGVYDEHGRMVADAVTLSTGSLPDATLEDAAHEGVITEVGDTLWLVEGVAVILPDGVSIIAPEGIDPGSLATPGNVATVTGFRFGENAIIATDIALRAAPRQADGNSAEHPAITVDQQQEQAEPEPAPPDAQHPQQDEPEPVREPDPVPPSNQDRGDDEDDDDGEDRETQQQDEKEREKQEKRDEQERKQQEKQREKDEKDRKQSMSPLESGVAV